MISKEGYSDKAWLYGNQPENMEQMKSPDGYAKIKGVCGDTMEMYIIVSDYEIVSAKFFTDGCLSTKACGTAITKLAQGKTINNALSLSPDSVLKFLGEIPEDHIHCAILAANTFHAAIAYFLLEEQEY